MNCIYFYDLTRGGRRNIDFIFQEFIIRRGKTNKFSLRKQENMFQLEIVLKLHKILQEDAFPRQFTTNGKICSEHAHMSVGGRFVAN